MKPPEPPFVEIALVQRDGKEHALLAFKRPGKPLFGHAIVGHLPSPSDGAVDWERFSANRPFVELFERYMRGALAIRPEVLTSARVAAGEVVYVIDRRTPNPDGDVPFHDIVGWYESDESGRPRAATFEYNADHKIALADGTLSSILSDRRVRDAVLDESNGK